MVRFMWRESTYGFMKMILLSESVKILESFHPDNKQEV